jgi:hypothetical protein
MCTDILNGKKQPKRRNKMQPAESKSKRHFYFSMIKSILRLGACYVLWATGDISLQFAGALLGLAELLGIAEEI